MRKRFLKSFNLFYRLMWSGFLIMLIVLGITACRSQKVHDIQKVKIVREVQTITWWGVMSFEININNIILHIDPCFLIHRRGDYVLCSHRFTDHSGIGTKGRILTVSPNLKIIIEPENCPTTDKLMPYTKHFSKGDIFEDEYFWIKGFCGFQESEDGITYLVYDKQMGLWFFHGGDAATHRAYEDTQAAFREVAPEKIDYYFCPLGKISIENIKQIVLEFKPRYLIPGHYPYYVMDFSESGTTVDLFESSPYARPEYSSDYFIKTMERWIKKNRLDTKVLVLKPGAEHIIIRDE
ncbi:MAG: hypothetical protein KKH94_10620 [Candidatus Omnitrophica bacterium]|nr:hypothetical protein [Candidatus Omnitrophota bacterium]